MSAWLSDELYQQVTAVMPLVTVDTVPIKKVNGEYYIGVITRATGREAGKVALLGGRILHNELIDAAIQRHLRESLGDVTYKLHPANPIERPLHVQQYLHADTSAEPLCFDPSKHAIALTYILTIKGEIAPANEASAFRWIAKNELPNAAGYNQQIVMRAAFEMLKKKG